MSNRTSKRARFRLARPFLSVLAAPWLALGVAATACAGPSPGTAPPEPEARRMAITIDDLPVTPPGRHTTDQQEEITRRLLTVLADHDAPEWVRELRESRSAATGPLVPATEAGPLVVERTELHHLVARANGVPYELRVSLPHGYAEPGRRFPVVYLLDADYSFLVARQITDHLAERDHLDEVIVVGLGYRDQEPGRTPSYRRNRTRDYTPTFVADGGYGPEYQRFSGGAPKFLEALETEIVPFIDRRYRTLPGDRTLVGHSYGGLFTVWTLLTRPALFQRYVAVSPSLWYDDHLPLRLEEARARQNDALPARLYLCVGSREGGSRIDMVGDLRDLARRLETRSYRGLDFESLVMEDETHNSIFPGCLSNGLRYVLEGR